MAHFLSLGSPNTFASMGLFDSAADFWQWLGHGHDGKSFMLEQVHCAVIGYMLKDFSVTKGLRRAISCIIFSV